MVALEGSTVVLVTFTHISITLSPESPEPKYIGVSCEGVSYDSNNYNYSFQPIRDTSLVVRVWLGGG